MKNLLLNPLFTIALLLSSYTTLANVTTASPTLPALLTKHKGEVIYLDFWASWCVPCRKSFPWMEQMRLKFQSQGLTIISVNVDAQPELAHQFLEKNPVGFPVVFDHQGLLAQEYKLKGMPSSYLIGRDGELKATHVGFFNNKKARYQAQIQALLAQQ